MQDGAVIDERPGAHFRAAIVGGVPGPGGRPVAQHRYPLGIAPDPEGGYIVSLLEDVPDVAGMTFEARDFEHAFARALAIAEDMAAASGRLGEGVLVSLSPRATLAEIGIDAD
ncbi:MAG TPA: hypothetical protein VKS60_21965 [Stellaceae bacterium]|nr:hypothetical protein [Stellaceae bacterium]